MSSLNFILARIDNNLEDALDRLSKLIHIPSISTDPAYKQQCQEAAHWLVEELTSLGFETSARATAGHPMVVAHKKAKRRDVPHLLFYAHYDVQPADPVELWTTPPFQFSIREVNEEKVLHGRGASDDKGQMMTFIEACRAWIEETGGLPCDVTILLEGEEETGSPSLPAFLEANKEELKADLMLVCDTEMWDHETPAITIMLRGLLVEEVVIRGANRDLHSGLFGGAAINPIRILGRIIGELHGEDGRIRLSNFYDGVEEIPSELADQWRMLAFDEEDFLQKIGLARPAGEKGRSILEMLWARPTCDVNGIVGGYTGKGSKTVLPAQASAKFSFRLVGRQSPEKILLSFRNFVQERLPSDCRAEFISHAASPALQLPFQSEPLRLSRRALLAEWNREPALIGSGGSIPIVGKFKRELGMDALMIGFARKGDCIHSPNENYALSSFHKGTRSWARILGAFAG